MLYQLQVLPIILSVFVFQLAKLSVMQLAFFLLMFFPSGKSQYLDFYEPLFYQMVWGHMKSYH